MIEETRIENELIEDMIEYWDDPLGFVMYAYEWETDKSIQLVELPEPWRTKFGCKYGPDEWACKFLDEMGEQIKAHKFDWQHSVPAIRKAVSSGHGVGKSCLTGWLVNFIMSTRPYAQGTVTANTSSQLETKTWPQIAKWTKKSITGFWFKVNVGRGSMKMVRIGHEEDWFCSAQTCREENSESFAGQHAANSTSFYINDEACHDDITEVLTGTGWKLFSQVKETDQLLTMDMKTGISYYDYPQKLHATYKNGTMLLREGHNSNFCITPSHNIMFYSNKLPKKRQFSQAGNMVWSNKGLQRVIDWVVPDTDFFIVPEYNSKRKNYPEMIFKMDDWCEFLGWYLTEGSIQKQNKVPGTVTISQIKEKNLDNYNEILSCIERMGLIPKQKWDGIYFYAPQIAFLLSNYGHNFFDKKIPCNIKNLSVRQLNIFLDTAVKGDGYQKGKAQILYTSSKQLADDYQEMILKTGYNSTVCIRHIKGQRKWIKDHWAVSSCDGYVVSRTFNHSKLSAYRAKPIEINYKGMVYCATISGGVLLTRRNGVALWSGNSAIPASIWEVQEGGLTDGEPMLFAFGNPTKNTGKFYDCFHKQKHRWDGIVIDSRNVQITNKKHLQEMIDDYGINSDIVKVRVRGMFPSMSMKQFISVEDADAGFGRNIRPDQYRFAPKIITVDPAWQGDDEFVIGMRQGLAFKILRTIPKNDNDMEMAALIASLEDEHKADAVFIDAGYGTGIKSAGDVLHRNHWRLVWFGGKSPDKGCLNMRAYMWKRSRDWLKSGGCYPEDQVMHDDLISPETVFRDDGKLQLESKKAMKARGLPSPGRGDVLGISFAYPVHKGNNTRGMRKNIDVAEEWKPNDYI